MMKGQLIFEFVIAALVFFVVLFYVIVYMSGAINTYHLTFKNDNLESRTVRASEIIMTDSDRGVVSRWPVIDSNAMTAFAVSCNDYTSLLNNLELLETTPVQRYYNTNITISDGSGSVLMSCGRDIPPTGTLSSVTRYGYISDTKILAKVSITVW